MVRDAIHSHDVLAAFEAFFRAPRSAAVYNLGGGRHSNCSNLEAFALAEKITGTEMVTEYVDDEPGRRPPVVDRLQRGVPGATTRTGSRSTTCR